MQVLDIAGFPHAGVPVIVNPRSGFPFGLRYRADSLTATGGDLTIVLGAIPYDGSLVILKNAIPLLPSAYSFTTAPNVVTLTVPTAPNDVYTVQYFAAARFKPAASYFAGAWTPSLLFSASQRGAYYDISDMSTLFQDSAGTTPVTATTQPVAKVLDKSGNGYHVTQSNSTSQRPTLQIDGGGNYYLQFSGAQVLYGPATGAVILGTSSMMTCVGFKFDGAGASQAIFGRAYGAANAGRWWGVIRTAGGALQAGYDKDGTNVATVGAADTDTSVRVATALFDRSTPTSLSMLINGSSFGTPALTTETSNQSTTTKYFRIGAFGDSSDHFNIANSEINYLTGRFYGGVVVFDTINTANRNSLQTWMGKKCGLVL